MDDASSMSMLANEPSFATRAKFAKTSKNKLASLATTSRNRSE